VSVTFHVEAATAPCKLARDIRAAGARAGMGLRPATPVDAYADLLPEIDMLLLMTVEPGFGGQKFLDVVVPKIRRARELVKGRDLDLWIQVDEPVDSIVRVDKRTGEAVPMVPQGHRPEVGSSGLWVVGGDWVVNVDPVTGKQSKRIRQGGGFTLARGAAIPWLAGQPADRRNTLLREGRLSRRQTGEWMHGEGDEETGVLAVVEGALKVYGQAPGGREALIGLLPAGTVIGQSAAFGGGPRIVTAITASPSLVFTLSDSALRRVAAAHPGLWEALSALVYGQLRLNAQAVAEFVALRPRERLVSRLLQMAAQTSGEIPVSQADLAEMIGVTRKAVNGWLGELEAAGFVRRGYGVIAVLEPARLERTLEQ